MIKDYYKIAIKQIKTYYLYIIIFGLYLLFFHFVFPHRSNCLFKNFIGLPCPGCGLTRAFLSFFKLDFVQALKYNPLFWLIPVIIFVVLFNERPIIGKIFNSKIFWTTIMIAFIGTYIYRMIYVYPDVPMDIEEDNLFNRIRKIFI